MDVNWQRVGSYEDIIFEKSDDGIARVTINRPQVRNAFRPLTVTEMIDAFADAARSRDRRDHPHRAPVTRPSAPAAIRRCAARPVTSAKTRCRG